MAAAFGHRSADGLGLPASFRISNTASLWPEWVFKTMSCRDGCITFGWTGTIIQEHSFANLGGGDYNLSVNTRNKPLVNGPNTQITLSGNSQFHRDGYYENDMIRRAAQSIHTQSLRETYFRKGFRLTGSIEYQLALVHDGPVYGSKTRHDIRLNISSTTPSIKGYAFSAVV